MSRIGPTHGAPGALPIGLSPKLVPWWMTTTWTFTPSLRRRSDSALIRAASGRNVSPAVAPAETSSGVLRSSAPMTPTLMPLTVNDGRRRDPRRRRRRSRSRRCSWPGTGSARVLVRQQTRHAEVELMVAVGRGIEPPQVLDVDRRHVLEERRVRRRGADVVAAGQDQARVRAAPRASSSNRVASWAAPPTGTVWPSMVVVVGLS